MEPTLFVDVGLAATGFALGRRNSSSVLYMISMLNHFLYYIVLPMIVLTSIFSTPSVSIYVFLIFLSILHMCILIISSLLLSRVVSSNAKDRMAAIMTSSLPNAGYLAIPLAMLILGAEYYVVPYAVAFNIVLSLSLILIGLKTSRGRNPNLLKSLPPIMAVTASIIMKQYLPSVESVVNGLSTFTSHAVRTSFLIVGYGLAGLSYSSLKSLAKPLLLISLVKIPYSLFIARIIFLFAAVPNEFIRGFMLQSVMPPAINNIVIARMFKLNEDLVAASIALITPISVILSIILFSFHIL